MNKKLAIPTILFLIVLPVSIFALSQEKNKKDSQRANQDNAKIILYYSNQCPHCKNIEQWMEANKIKEKISFPEKEVRSNKDNADELMEKAAACQIPGDTVGVPFLWDGENGDKCIMGDSDIISFLEDKLSTNSGNTVNPSTNNTSSNGKIMDSSKNNINTK